MNVADKAMPLTGLEGSQAIRGSDGTMLALFGRRLPRECRSWAASRTARLN